MRRPCMSNCSLGLKQRTLQKNVDFVCLFQNTSNQSIWDIVMPRVDLSGGVLAQKVSVPVAKWSICGRPVEPTVTGSIPGRYLYFYFEFFAFSPFLLAQRSPCKGNQA